MIPKAFIKDFLKQARDDHRWMKRLTHKEIDNLLAGLRPRPRIESGLRLHQKVCIYLGIAYPQFCFWLDMGTGKTCVALHLLRYWWDCRRINRALILIKNSKAFPTWEKQFKRWNIDIPLTTLDAYGSQAKWADLAYVRDGIVIVPYPSAVAMSTKRTKITKGKKKGKTVEKLVPALVKDLSKYVDALVLDESTVAGHASSLTSQLCYKLRAPITYALAGRPFGRDPKMLWSQYNIVDGGETLGETMGLFYSAFYTEHEHQWSDWAKDYKFNKNMKSELMRVAQHRSISYEEDECPDLPKNTFTPILEEVRLPEEAEAYYERVVEQIISARGNLSAMENAFLRMRQLSSGFLGFRNDDTQKRVEVAFADNPKLERTLDCLSDLPDDRKAIVFYDFTYSGRLLYERLQQMNWHGIWVWSQTKDFREQQRRFLENPKHRVAVLNNKIGAYSLDGLQDVANYTMFYESPVSVIDREQAHKRLCRQGQRRHVFEYDFVVRGTLDHRILDFHREGDDLLAALRANPKELMLW